ncbi:MAG: HipA N-terminal domain-containing protein, partial [Bacteroidales bacterium]|nr:HipA N-terminal domain-containing protein [Bacteroidales bacterium]
MNKIKALEVFWGDALVGRLALTADGLCAFEYAGTYIGSGVSVSPFELPLKNGVAIAKPRPFAGGFGVFDDCL